MDSSSVIFFACAVGVTIFLLAILYFLYKCLMRETPYQRTLLVEEVEQKHGVAEKRNVKKSKSTTVRQRIVAKSGEVGEKIMQKESIVAVDKPALVAASASDLKLPVVVDHALTSAGSGTSIGGKADVRKKLQGSGEKAEKIQPVTSLAVKSASSRKPIEELLNEADATKQQVSSAAAAAAATAAAAAAKPPPVIKEDKVKVKPVQAISSATNVEQQQQQQQQLVRQQDKKEDKKAQQQKQAKEAVTYQEKLDETHLEQQQQLQQPVDKKKKGKKTNDVATDGTSTAVEQKVKQEISTPAPDQVTPTPIVEDVVIEQRSRVTPNAPAPQQHQQHVHASANKKKSGKAKVLDEFDAPIESPVIQLEARQQKVAPPTDGIHATETQHPVVGSSDSRLQFHQQQPAKMAAPVPVTSSHSDVERLKRLVEEKDVINQRDQHQLKSLNEAVFQLKKDLSGERSRLAELDSRLAAAKQHNDEKQSILNSLRQNDQQNQQTMQMLKQKLQANEANSGKFSLIMTELADENTKLKGDISHLEKQLKDELAQRTKTAELLNESLRCTQIALDRSETNNKNLESKFKQAEDRSRSLEIKQKEMSDAMSHMEKLYIDQQQEYLKMQGQPNIELQNQLRTVNVENEEMHSLVQELRKELDDIKLTPIITESIQQQSTNQLSNGCNDTGLVSHLEAKLAEQEEGNKVLLEKFDVTDQKNKSLEMEIEKLVSSTEKLKNQVTELETELENSKIAPIVSETVVVQQAEPTNQLSNGCSDANHVVQLEASLAEKDTENKGLLEKLEAKDKKNEDLRQRNWKTMEALQETEKRLVSINTERNTHLKDLEIEISNLKAKLIEVGKNPTAVEAVAVQQVSVVNKSRGPSEGDRVKVGEGEDPEIENVKELKLVAKANQICIERQDEEIRNVSKELQVQRNKNDELRKKNWAIMSFLNETEKKVEDLKVKLEQSECQMEELKLSMSLSTSKIDIGEDLDNNIVRKEYTVVNKVKETCHWDMSQLVLDLDTKTAEIEILQSLLDQYEDAISVLKSEKAELQEKLSLNKVVNGENSASSDEVKDQMRVADEVRGNLEQQVEHYKKVLADTETILKTLESSVDAEEDKWRKKIQKLEKEVAVLRDEKTGN